MVYLSRESKGFGPQARSASRSERELAISTAHKTQMRVPTILVQQRHSKDGSPQNTTLKYFLSFAIDILPCLIVAIWATAVFFTMRIQSK